LPTASRVVLPKLMKLSCVQFYDMLSRDRSVQRAKGQRLSCGLLLFPCLPLRDKAQRAKRMVKRLLIIVSIAVLTALAVCGCIDHVNSPVAPKSSRTPTAANTVALTVNSVATHNSVGKRPMQITSSPGLKYVILNVTVTNLNGNSLYMGNPNFFKLTTSDGMVFSLSEATFRLGDYIAGVSNTVPGNRVTGSVVFEIPQDASPTQLTYGDGSNGVVTAPL